MPDAPQDFRTFLCPHCGESVSAGARVCRNCGASDDSGWNESEFDEFDGYRDDEDFDYDEFIASEFPESAPLESAAAARKSLIRLVILAIVVSLLLTMVF